MKSKWRRDLDAARPWMLLQFAPLVIAFALVSHAVLPAPQGVIVALTWLALLCFMVVVTVRRHRSNRQ